MGKYPDSVNKYNHTPRKVFDKYTEKIERQIAQLKLDIRALEKALMDYRVDQQDLLSAIDGLEERFVVLEDYLPQKDH